MRPAVKTPRLTAGLIWQPETGPMPYAAAISPKPKANAIPKTPTLSPATTAVPQPKSTRMNVPINSARYFFMITPPVFVAYLRAHTDLTAGPEAREDCQWRNQRDGNGKRRARRASVAEMNGVSQQK